MKKRSGDDSRCLEREMMMQKPRLGTPLDWEKPLNDGCVFHLAMNEGHGNEVQDLSLNGNHGTLNNFAFPPTSISGWNPGQTGIGLNFSQAGSNYVECERVIDCVSKNSEHSVSVLAYISSDEVAAGRTIIGNSHAADDRVGIVYRDGLIRCGLYHGAGYLACSGAASLNRWYHIAYTYDTTNIACYIDGIKQSGVGSPFLSSAAKLIIGAGTDLLSKFADGAIDQPRVYNRILSAKEVKDYAMNPWQVYEQ